MDQDNIGIIILLGIVALIFLLAVGLRFAQFLNKFSQELRYLNIEIRRSTGRERKHWVRRRRKLWRSLLPFFHY